MNYWEKNLKIFKNNSKIYIFINLRQFIKFIIFIFVIKYINKNI